MHHQQLFNRHFRNDGAFFRERTPILLNLVAGFVHRIAPMFIRALLSMLTSIKVSFLLACEVLVFPLLCGCWLNVCVTPLLTSFRDDDGDLAPLSLSTLSCRLSLFYYFPFMMALSHWITGVGFMMMISVIILLLRTGMCIAVYDCQFQTLCILIKSVIKLTEKCLFLKS